MCIRDRDYPTKIQNMLRGRNVSDVIMVKDEYIKSWVELGGIAPLDEFVAESDVISLDNLWAGGVNRFRYNTQTLSLIHIYLGIQMISKYESYL